MISSLILNFVLPTFNEVINWIISNEPTLFYFLININVSDVKWFLNGDKILNNTWKWVGVGRYHTTTLRILNIV
jgi:hypothetical protein